MSNALSGSDDADNYPANAPALKSIVTGPRAVHLNSNLTTHPPRDGPMFIYRGGGAQSIYRGSRVIVFGI